MLIRISFLVLCSLSVTVAAHANSNIDNDMAETLAVAKQRCAPAVEGGPVVYNDDFRWNMSLEDLDAKFKEIYSSGKRLKGRAYYDPTKDEFLLTPQLEESPRVRLPGRLIYSVRRHIEEALKMEYAQYVIFPDMGHSHFFLPNEFYEKKIQPLPVARQNEAYELMMGHPGTLILYHTAEQLRMKDEDKQLLPDPFLQWRYYTRNPVGDNEGRGRIEIHKDLERKFNTVGQAEGYRYWGGGFDLSASAEGCFPYTFKGQTYYFDISLLSLPSKASENWGG